jgi:sporulation protein YlmC with PRC-barrel domain
MTNHLAKSGDLQGKHLIGTKNDRLGSVRELYLDLASGQVAYLVVEPPSLLGGSGKFQPIPWSAVSYDAVSGDFRADMDKARFKAAPSYDREQLANPAYGWPDQVTGYFSGAA